VEARAVGRMAKPARIRVPAGFASEGWVAPGVRHTGSQFGRRFRARIRFRFLTGSDRVHRLG